MDGETISFSENEHKAAPKKESSPDEVNPDFGKDKKAVAPEKEEEKSPEKEDKAAPKKEETPVKKEEKKEKEESSPETKAPKCDMNGNGSDPSCGQDIPEV